MAVSPSTVLRLAPDVSVRFRSGNEIVVEAAGVRCDAGPHGIAVIEQFRTAITLGEGLQRLGERVRDVQDWIELSATVHEFARLGILHDPAATAPVLGSSPAYFDSARPHIDMLDDRTRTSRYLAAVREVVRPGDIVVDLGTGTGLLATAALQAGAARVYAIESTRIADAARLVFKANGVSDGVILVEGHSTRVTLPERADVLLAEIIGLDPLGENVLEFTRDAVQRFLVPEARLVPSVLEMFALPVELPHRVLRHFSFTREKAERWKGWYGVDFSPLVDLSTRSLYAMSANSQTVHEWPALAAPACMLRQDLRSIAETALQQSTDVSITASGVLSAVALYFRLQLSPGVSISTDPREPRADNHWDHLVWALPSPAMVEQGDTVEITLRHRVNGPPLEVRTR